MMHCGRPYILLLIIALVGLALLACGTANMGCYSQYPGCEATAAARAAPVAMAQP